jgi:hypothetical protein
MATSPRCGVLLATMMAVTACGDDGASGASVPIEDLADAYADAMCSRYARCGVVVSAAACRDSFRLSFATIQHSVEEGRIAYDGAAVASCLAGLAAAACDVTSESSRVDPAACAQAIRGTVPDGQTCHASNECASESCDLTACSDGCCTGTCDPTVAEAAIGQPCSASDCVEGAFCDASETCAALLPAGRPCAVDDWCSYGLSCVDDVCVDSANRGDACAAGTECHDLGDRCDGAMRCVARSGLGGGCGDAGFDGVFDCQAPLVCDTASRTCEDPPTIGQPCQTSCAAGAFCNAGRTCEAPRVNGMPCQVNPECASNYCDTSQAPVCADPPICG